MKKFSFVPALVASVALLATPAVVAWAGGYGGGSGASDPLSPGDGTQNIEGNLDVGGGNFTVDGSVGDVGFLGTCTGPMFEADSGNGTISVTSPGLISPGRIHNNDTLPFIVSAGVEDDASAEALRFGPSADYTAAGAEIASFGDRNTTTTFTKKLGIDLDGALVPADGSLNVIGSLNPTGQIVSTVTTGTAPLTVASTTVVTNLNADTVRGVAITGTPDGTKFLRDDGVWSAVSAGWEYLGSVSLGGAANTTGPLTIAARSQIMVVWRVTDKVQANDEIGFRFNADSGNNYAWRNSQITTGTTWAASEATSTAQFIATVSNPGADPLSGSFYVTNRATEVKQIHGNGSTSASAATVPRHTLTSGLWANTADQITSIEMLTVDLAGNLSAGSGFAVFGKDF